MWCYNLNHNMDWMYLAKERAQSQILVCMVLNELNMFHTHALKEYLHLHNEPKNAHW